MVWHIQYIRLKRNQVPNKTHKLNQLKLFLGSIGLQTQQEVLKRRLQRRPLTWVLIASVRARYQSLMTLSISDWISSSVPCRVFSCRRGDNHRSMLSVLRGDNQQRSWRTSITCFLLDFSLEAHSTNAPRKSTVNSGFD